MPKIVITEIDETTPGVVNESTDVVYIPGLVDITQPALKDKDGNYIGLEYRQPKLFTSVSEFVTWCGERPVKFEADLEYGEGFPLKTNALPVEGIFLHAGDSDPSYVMAKELLAAGLCVMYERLNAGAGSYVKCSDGENTDRYYYKVTSGNTPEYRPYGSKAAADHIPDYNSLGELHKITLWVPENESRDKPADFDTYFANYYRLGTDNKLVAYATATDAVDRARTYTIDDAIASIADDTWASTYNNYAVKTTSGQKVTYTAVVKVKTPFDANNCYDYIEGMSLQGIYSELEDVFSIGDELVDGIIDKGNYSIKYLTSGGYPVYEYNNNSIVSKMLAFAEKRGDCVAFIDHTDNKDRILNPYKDGSLYKAVEADANTTFKANGDFGTMFTPWATYNRTTSDGEEEDEDGAKVPYSHTSFRAPASFAYLTALADSIKTNANWLAIAGATRGGVINLASGGMDTIISNGAADAMQPRDAISINAITNIKPYGNTIWGNRTLKKNVDNLVATSFLNIRNLVSDVKKTCYRTARAMTFEQDTDILWINFKAEISKLLNRMVSGYGISGYKIIRDTTHVRAKEKATICAKVILYPTYAVEDFYITIVLKDDEVTVE